MAVSPPLAQLAVYLAFTLTIGLLLTFPTAGVEEIGWRGYLLPRPSQAGVPQLILISALVWGAWHIPIVVAGAYLAGSSLPITIVMLMITATAFGCILAWLRLGTESIWPCVLAHVVSNTIINGTLMPAAQGPQARLWAGETGLLVVAALLLLLMPLIWRAWRPAASRPGLAAAPAWQAKALRAPVDDGRWVADEPSRTSAPVASLARRADREQLLQGGEAR